MFFIATLEWIHTWAMIDTPSIGYLALAFIAGVFVGESWRSWFASFSRVLRSFRLRRQRCSASLRATSQVYHPGIRPGEPRRARVVISWSKATVEAKLRAAQAKKKSLAETSR